MKSRIFLKDILEQESRELEELLHTSSKPFDVIFNNSPAELRIKLSNLNLSNLYSAFLEEKDLERISTFICLHPYDEDCLLLGLAGALGIKSSNLREVQQAKEYLTKALMIDSGYASYLELLSEASSREEMERLLDQLEENIYVLRYKYLYSNSLEIAIKIWEIDPLWNPDLLIAESRQVISSSKHRNLPKMIELLSNRIEIAPFENSVVWDCLFEGIELLDEVEDFFQSRSWWLEYLDHSCESEEDYRMAEKYRRFAEEALTTPILT